MFSPHTKINLLHSKRLLDINMGKLVAQRSIQITYLILFAMYKLKKIPVVHYEIWCKDPFG